MSLSATVTVTQICIAPLATSDETLSRPLVVDVDLAIAPGERLALLGTSGSGKTLTALAIAQALPRGVRLSQGSISFGSNPKPDHATKMAHPVAMVFQDARAALLPVRRAGDLIDDVLRDAGIAATQRRQHCATLLQEVGLVDHHNDSKPIARLYPFEMSGGMCQRLLIAMSLARNPRLLIADEPTTGLDAANATRVMELIVRVTRERGMSLLLITHDIAIAERFAHRTLVMEEGRIVDTAVAARFVSSANNIDSGKGISASDEPTAHVPRPLFQAHSLTKRFGRGRHEKTVLAQVSLTLQSGDALGIQGPSGCGKSTLALTLARLIDADAGQIFLDETDLTAQRAKKSATAPWRHAIQYVFQDAKASLSPLMQVREILRDAWRGGGLATDDAIDALALSVGLPLILLERYAATLSGGEAARVALARALASTPRILILDEATASLDAHTQARVLAMLDERRRNGDFSLIVVSHDEKVLRTLCARRLCFPTTAKANAAV